MGYLYQIWRTMGGLDNRGGERFTWGTRVRFWHDTWFNLVFKDVFPELYRIVVDKNASTASYLNGRQSWNPQFNK